LFKALKLNEHLKGEPKLIIRPIRKEDGAAFLEMLRAIDAETRFMLFEPGERKTTLEQQLEQIKNILSQENSIILVAQSDAGQLVGYLTGAGGIAERNRHCVEIVIGILKDFTGQKIGTKLFAELESWARSQGIRRLGLGLMSVNETALALYTKMGFEIEGRKREVFYVDGEYIDEYIMSKLL
jgi:RimJ/RimL family protein N-acetyltransferase